MKHVQLDLAVLSIREVNHYLHHRIAAEGVTLSRNY